MGSSSWTGPVAIQLNLNELFSPAQLEVLSSNNPYQLLYGGRGSSKTTALVRKAVLKISLNPKHRLSMLIAREFQVSLQLSLVPALRDAIIEMGMEPFWRMDLNIPQPRYGGRVYNMGLSGKSPSALKALHKIDICLIDEIQELTESSAKILIPTLFRTPYCQVWVAGNPENEKDWFWQRFMIRRRETDFVKEMNYGDNPWFSYESNEQRKDDKATLSAEEYEHIWMGKLKPLGRGSLLNRNDWDALSVPRPESGCSVYLGGDLSLRRDASAVLWLYNHDEGIWVEPWIYATKETIRHKLPNGECLKLAGWVRESDRLGEIDREAIARDVRDRLKTLKTVERFHFDPFAATSLKALGDLFPRIAFKPYRTAFETMDEPTRMLKSLVRNKQIHHDGNPLMSWMIGNADEAIKTKDDVRYSMPQKSKPDRHIDGVAALVYALSALIAGPVAIKGDGGVWITDDRGRYMLAR